MMFKTLNFTFAGEKAALKKYKANVIGRKTNIKVTELKTIFLHPLS